VDILVVAGVRGITRLASIENAKSLVYAQVSLARFFFKSIVGWRPVRVVCTGSNEAV
jgi:hypothetical protein